MGKLQAYLLGQIVGPLIAILCGLLVVAVLTQGLTRLDIIVDQRQSGVAFLWVTLLAMPQVVGLVLPLALFCAVAYAINRLLTENELVAGYAAGLSPMQIVAPVMKLATVAALVHLSFTTLIQPASYRELRETLFTLRADVAASLVREGSFTRPADGVTIYARQTGSGGRMSDLLIHDARNADQPTTYTARRGMLASAEGAPAMILYDGQIQQPKEDGSIDLLNFDQYVLTMEELAPPDSPVLFKASDRYLSELFFPDVTNYYDQQNADEFLAEGHSRIADPLNDYAMALLALAFLLRGDLNRLGYGRRLAAAAAAALTVRLVGLTIVAACADTPTLNPLQYLFPLSVCAVAIAALIRPRAPARKPRRLLATAAP